MKLILQETINKLGKLGEVVTVSPGYGRNYLVPYGKAVPATKSHIEAFEKRRVELEKLEAQKLAEANARADVLRDYVLPIAVRVSEEGSLYGSVGPLEIVAAFADNNVEVCKSEVLLADVIREIGEHEAHIKLHSDVEVVIKVVVKAEESES